MSGSRVTLNATARRFQRIDVAQANIPAASARNAAPQAGARKPVFVQPPALISAARASARSRSNGYDLKGRSQVISRSPHAVRPAALGNAQARPNVWQTAKPSLLSQMGDGALQGAKSSWKWSLGLESLAAIWGAAGAEPLAATCAVLGAGTFAAGVVGGTIGGLIKHFF